jgi:methylenetetrahydrofolate reductase (NADPH)
MSSRTLTVSFEFFPPKTEEGLQKLFGEQRKLQSLQPDFFSVTYGAGGSTRDKTVHVVKETFNTVAIPTAPHISCVGDSKENIAELLEIYKEAGIHRLVALRGDLPSGTGLGRNELRYASDLVSFIREQTGDHFHIEVAAYPEVHPESKSMQADFDSFRTKVDAGANSAITQYFFNIDAYCDFMDRCEAANINIPVVPGIMPITNYEKLARFSKMCGAEIPRWLDYRLQDLSETPEALQEFGREFITELCDGLIQTGAPGLHFYTLNQAAPTLAICEKLSLSGYLE